MRFQSQKPDGGYVIAHVATPVPFLVRAEVTADNTSVRVSWGWLCQSVLDLVRVHYQPEGGSLMMYTVNNTTATSATLPNLQCNTDYTIWVHASGGLNNSSSLPRMVNLPARGMFMLLLYSYCINCSTAFAYTMTLYTTPAPPTPTEVTARLINASSLRVAWQWTSSSPAPNCFNTTTVTYRPEGGGESSLQLSDPAATETTLIDLQCNINYTITVVTTAGNHRREGVPRTVSVLLQGILQYMCLYIIAISFLDISIPVGVRAEATADNTSIRVSWQWSCQDVLDLVRVDYQPEGDSLMMYTVDNTTAITNATLPNLQCSTKYTIWIYYVQSGMGTKSVPIMVSLPARGVCIMFSL